jgi:hypothetical protein
VCDPTRPTTVVSGGPGRRRWEFMCLPGETLDALDEAARAWELLEPWDVNPTNATMVRHAGYRFQARWATSWHAGRVFLAGDAVHLTPPFAGQGMCAGLRDAVNLAWKLDHVLSHPEAAHLLETYDEERIPHAAKVIGFAIELGRVICVPDPADAAARDADMAAAATGGDAVPTPEMPALDTGLFRFGTPAAGELFVQGRVGPHSSPKRFDDVFGPGWRLVTDGQIAVPVDLRQWFESIGGAIVAMEANIDPDLTYRQWFDTRRAVAALQRPDFHVYGTAATADEVITLLGELRDRLSAFARGETR